MQSAPLIAYAHVGKSFDGRGAERVVAVDGHGILLRSLWNVGPLLRSGKLVQILPEFTQEANVWAVYPSRLETSAKVRVCVEWLQESLRTLTPTDVEPADNGIGV